jgi:ornithine cyclodeaminase/alanine dehydrogenase-like protein (mu-crystallin family)
VDRRESAAAEAGAFRLAIADGAIGEDHIRAEVGEVLVGSAAGRSDDGELTVFESLGVAVEDLFAAEYLYERAQAEGRGVMVEFGA